AVVHILAVGFGEALGRTDLAVFQMTAFLVAVAIERRNFAGSESRSLLQHAIDQLAIQTVAQALAVAGSVEQFVQHEAHIAQWCLIAHISPSCTSLKHLFSPARRSISVAGCQCAPKRSVSCKRR